MHRLHVDPVAFLRKPKRVRQFYYASMRIQLDAEMRANTKSPPPEES